MEVVGNQRGVNFLTNKTPDALFLSPGVSPERVSSFIWPTLLILSPLSLCPPHNSHSLSSLPSSARCSQTARWGSFHPAWWVCSTCRWGDEQSEEVPYQFQQGGGTECGDPCGGWQEDAGETRQRERHHLRPNSHEHGEVGEERQRPPRKWDEYSRVRIMENNVDETCDHLHWLLLIYSKCKDS